LVLRAWCFVLHADVTSRFFFGTLWLSLALAVIVPRAAAADDLRLIDAVKRRDAAALRTALKSSDSPNAADAAGTTALHWAVELNDLQAADALIKAGANVKAVNRYGVPPLMLACVNGSAPMVERLLQGGADPNSSVPEGETVLMTAARTGALPVVRLLLARGADVNVQEKWKGQSALMWAVAQQHGEVAGALVAAGADVKARSKGGFTPLLFALRAGDRTSVSVLLDAGAPVSETAPDGTSALVLAILNARYELAALLLERGADPNVREARGSALHVLAWMRSPGYIGTTTQLPPVQSGTLDSLELARRLLARGADPNARLSWRERETFDAVSGRVRVPANVAVAPTYISADGATPFWLAAKHADVPLMRLLAAHGADPKLPTTLNVSPLIAAAGLGFWEGESPGTNQEALEAVKLAVQLGNDVNASADFGKSQISDARWSGSTALHGAAIRGADSVVQYLVDQGARMDVKNSSGWTPLNMAEGVFVSNTWKEKPETAALIRRLMDRPALGSTVR
jgi:ankyrin repeat protein